MRMANSELLAPSAPTQKQLVHTTEKRSYIQPTHTNTKLNFLLNKQKMKSKRRSNPTSRHNCFKPGDQS